MEQPLVVPLGGEFEGPPEVSPSKLEEPVLFVGVSQSAGTLFRAPDLAAIAADGPFVPKVCFSVIGESPSGDRLAVVGARLTSELPGSQGLGPFDHEIPMLAADEAVM